MTIRVLVADDQALVRGSFRILVSTAPDLTPVGEASTGAEAIELARREKPDVVLLDIRMPGLDGIEATRQITTSPETSGVRVLILTTFDLDEYVFAALRAGASGYLLKDTPPADLLAAIRVIAAGDALLDPRRHPAAHRRVHPPARPRPCPRPAGARARGDNRTGTRSPDAGRARLVQHRDRREAARQHVHRQDPRRPPADEAGRAGSRPAGHRRL